MKKKKILPYSRQYITKDDIFSVNKVLKSDFLTKGKKTLEFEKKSKKFLKVKYTASVINASSALILCCKALNIGKKDIVWTSANTYVASINCAIHCNSKIDLVDINLEDYNIDLIKLKEKLEKAKKKNLLPKLLIVVHLAGYTCDMQKIKDLSKKYKFKIIEDASHAFGAKYKNSKIGECKYSDFTVFSFHPVKVITTGEGGLICTKKKLLYHKIISLRENGKVINSKHYRNIYDPNFYDINDIGYNFRLNEINATLGISQIKKTNLFIKKKQNIAKYYFKNLDKNKFILPNYSSDRKCSWHLFIVRFKPNIMNNNLKKKVILYLKKRGIFVNTHYIPLNYLKLIRSKLKVKKFICAENYYNSSISIPIFPQLSKKEQNYIVNTLNNSIKE